MGHLVVLTGPPGSGKSTVCARLAEAARAGGLEVAGLLSPPLPGRGASEARAVVDLATGDSRTLAVRDASNEADRHWALDAEAVAWGARAAIDGAPAADLLVIDELGPLELVNGAGWIACLDLVRRSTSSLIVVVVRPSLVDRFRDALERPVECVMEVTSATREAMPSALLELL